MNATKSYRITLENKIDSSSEEGELSSDNEIIPQVVRGGEKMETVAAPTVATMQPKAKRGMKNIWTEVLTDQSSNDITSSLGTVGMKGFLSRGPESFSIEPVPRNRDDYSSDSSGEAPHKMRKTETIEEEMENYMIERHFLNQSHKTKSSQSTNPKRKRAKKVKPGMFPGSTPGQRVILNKKLEISIGDSEDKVADELVYRLWEKKRDLIKALVRCIGVERSLFLYNKTEMLELNGGLMTLKGNRRRTPGGTFLHLLRSDEGINQEEVNKIFDADYHRDREQWLAVKEMKKVNKKANVGRTPHNSPQMESTEGQCDDEKIDSKPSDNGHGMESTDYDIIGENSSVI